jgi:coenzyme F420-0:L-glutamate ligase/coenzyme F420-1:gamma-L-glutamate ligase
LEKSIPLVLTPIRQIPLVQPGDNIARLLATAVRNSDLELLDDDIFVITQKVISKSEGRFVNLSTIVPSPEAITIANQTEKDPRFVELVLRESKVVMRTRPGTLIVEHRLGFVCANAGIDHSNVQSLGGNPDDWVLLLPENPDASAGEIREKLEAEFLKKLGVLIIDSHGRAWRIGTVGVAIGFSGIPGVVDLRGKPDMFGYQLRVTQVAAVDELAAAASLLMGQAAENIPVIHVRGFPYPLREGSFKELIRPSELDLFR